MSQDRLLRTTLASSVALAVTLSAQPSLALNTADYFELSLEQLMEVKIHAASKKEESISNAPAAVYVVTNEDITRSGVTNIPDALRLVPGMMVARTDSNSWAISIRGFNSTLTNKLLVLVDGRSIYNPVFGGVLWEAHNLMLEDIERIEVVRGPGGALWGANAVNGVINIITRHTRATQGTVASAVYGNEEHGTLSARHGGSFGDDGHYRVYAKSFKQDASHKPVSAPDNSQDTYDEWDGFRTGFRTDWADQFTLQGDAYRTNAQQLRTRYSLIAPYATAEQQLLRYEGINLLGRWIDKRDDGSQLSIQSYVDWAKRDEPVNFIDDRMTYDLDAQYNFAPLQRHDIILGAGFRYLTDDQRGDRNTTFSPQQRRNNLYSAFVQDKITLAPDTWFLTLGSKFEHNDFSGFEVQPNARLQWHPDQNKTVWAAISRAVRTPTPLEEDVTSTLITAQNIRAALVPNDHFKSEQLTAYELGYRHQLTNDLSLDLAAFYNDYEHLRTTTASAENVTVVNNGVDPIHILIPFMFTNDMKGTTEGIEAVLSWNIRPDLKLAANYSYMNMSLTALDPTQETDEKLAPKHQAGVKLFWNMTTKWTLDVTTSYVDKLPITGVDSYVRMDVNLGTQVSKSLRINITGQNLLEDRQREFGGIEDINVGEIERSLFAKLTWQF
ncbi:MAG: TonB-dependent receptor [Cellvibrio sp.]|uniref:TonB-dependent receptor plug domain-containing protein n=1 Tax=Cellvibrio sp. TaxID=1965322 RepID=UPI0031B3AB6C